MLIRSDELPEFKEELKKIIQNMKIRSFIHLRKRVLPIIEKLCSRAGRPFSENMFSKHYWCSFQKTHNDIYCLWKALPRKKLENQSTNSEEKLLEIGTTKDDCDPDNLKLDKEVENMEFIIRVPSNKELPVFSDEIQYHKSHMPIDQSDLNKQSAQKQEEEEEEKVKFEYNIKHEAAQPENLRDVSIEQQMYSHLATHQQQQQNLTSAINPPLFVQSSQMTNSLLTMAQTFDAMSFYLKSIVFRMMHTRR